MNRNIVPAGAVTSDAQQPGRAAGAPAAAAANAQPPTHFHTGLCECCADDAGTCLSAFCLPCVSFGTISELLVPNTFSSPCMMSCLACCCCGNLGLCIYGIIKRGEMRKSMNIVPNDIEDMLLSCCCLCCSLIQQTVEIKRRKGLLEMPAAKATGPPQVQMN